MTLGTDELREHAAERKRYVDHQPVFVAAEIKDGPIVAHKIDSASELGALSRPDLPNALWLQSRAMHGSGPLHVEENI
jgi:hypothetical protein